MIKFNQLKIKHFRSYQDITVDFDYDNGVYLVIGDVGAGKSTFLNAINWCLYGDTPFYSVKKYIEVSNIDDPVGTETSVELFATIDDLEYRFYRRTQKGQSAAGSLTVQCLDPANGNWDTLSTASSNDAVRRFVPKEIRQLFFFNGEQLKDIYSGANTPDGKNSLKDNIYKISEIEIIDNGINHLTRLEKSYMNEIGKKMKNERQIEEIEEDIKQYESAIEGCDELITQYKGEIADINARINALNTLIINTADARKLLSEEKIYAKQVDDYNSRINVINGEIDELIVSNFGSVVLFDQFSDYVKKLEDARSKDLIPAPVSPKVTQHILDTGVCICGKHIDDAARDFIEKQHEDYSRRQELQFLTDGIYEYSGLVKLLPEVRYNYIDKNDDIDDLTDQKMKSAKELQKVRQALTAIDTANIPDNPELARETLEDQKTKKIILLTNAGTKKDEAIQALKAAKIKLQNTISHDVSVAGYERKRAKTEVLINELKTLRDQIEKTIKAMLEKNIWEIFSSILPDTGFTGVEITDTYSIHLRSKKQKLYSAEMFSTGQAKILGLSLVHALSKDLGYSDVPLLIDNLYGDISPAQYKNVSRMITSLAEHKQIIIMNLRELNINDEILASSIKARYLVAKGESDQYSTFTKEM